MPLKNGDRNELKMNTVQVDIDCIGFVVLLFVCIDCIVDRKEGLWIQYVCRHDKSPLCALKLFLTQKYACEQSKPLPLTLYKRISTYLSCFPPVDTYSITTLAMHNYDNFPGKPSILYCITWQDVLKQCVHLGRKYKRTHAGRGHTKVPFQRQCFENKQFVQIPVRLFAFFILIVLIAPYLYLSPAIKKNSQF